LPGNSILNPPPPSDALQKQKKKLEDLFSSVLSQFKKYRPSGNLKCNNLGIFPELKLHILMEKNPSNLSQAKFHYKYFGILLVKSERRWRLKWETIMNYRFSGLIGHPKAKVHSKEIREKSQEQETRWSQLWLSAKTRAVRDYRKTKVVSARSFPQRTAPHRAAPLRCASCLERLSRH